jgi:hypothetical protein
MVAFQFYLQSAKKRKIGWMADKKFPDENRIMRWCVVMQETALLFSCSRRKMSQYYLKLTAWLSRTNPL